MKFPTSMEGLSWEERAELAQAAAEGDADRARLEELFRELGGDAEEDRDE